MKFKSILFTLTLSVLAFSFVKAQTTDEIIGNYITAKGGADKIRAVNNIIMKGNINQGGQKIPLTITIIHNKALRVEFSFNGLTGYQILTDKEGWNLNPFAGQTKAEAMTADDVTKSQDQLDVQDDLLDYAQKGTTIDNLGKDDVEGTECYKLKLTLKSGKEKTYFINTEDNMLVKVSEKITANGQEVESATTFSNYQKAGDAVMFAFTQTNSFQGQIDFETIFVNQPIDEKIFKP